MVQFTRQINCYLVLCSCWMYGVSAVPVTTQLPDHDQFITEVGQVETLPPAENVRQMGRNFQESGRGMAGTARIFPAVFGDVFQTLPFLPLNINVPDVFSGMYSLVNQYFGGNSNPRPTSGRRKHRKRVSVPSTTTTTTAYPPLLESLSRDSNRVISNQEFEEIYQEYVRKKDEFDKLTKKKKKRKHKEDDMLHKIASHLAYLELEC